MRKASAINLQDLTKLTSLNKAQSQNKETKNFEIQKFLFDPFSAVNLKAHPSFTTQ